MYADVLVSTPRAQRLAFQLSSLERHLNLIQKSCPHRATLVCGVWRYRIGLTALAAGFLSWVFRIARARGTLRAFGLAGKGHRLSLVHYRVIELELLDAVLS